MTLVDESRLTWLAVECSECGRDGLWCPSSRLVVHPTDDVCVMPELVATRTVTSGVPWGLNAP